jgi:hypothetical protein
VLQNAARGINHLVASAQINGYEWVFIDTAPTTSPRLTQCGRDRARRGAGVNPVVAHETLADEMRLLQLSINCVNVSATFRRNESFRDRA